ncbi:MAG: hypothetical protein Alis3KO_41090 [Aliiglaciecola sp.]
MDDSTSFSDTTDNDDSIDSEGGKTPPGKEEGEIEEERKEREELLRTVRGSYPEVQNQVLGVEIFKLFWRRLLFFLANFVYDNANS